MYLIAERYSAGGERLTIPILAARLGYPGIAVARMCKTFEASGFLAAATDESLLPGRDIAQIPVVAILMVARSQSRGLIRTATATPAVVLDFCTELESAWQQRCAGMMLSELLQRAP
jgi:hypothetical protein